MVVRTRLAALALIAGESSQRISPSDSSLVVVGGVPEEVKRNVRVFPGSVVILAVHDSSLRRVKLQFALPESTPDGVQHRTRLPLTAAVDDGIVRIALELDVRKRPPHPRIERIVQKEISQQRTVSPPNAKGNFQLERIVEGWRSRAVLDLRRK